MNLCSGPLRHRLRFCSALPSAIDGCSPSAFLSTGWSNALGLFFPRLGFPQVPPAFDWKTSCRRPEFALFDTPSSTGNRLWRDSCRVPAFPAAGLNPLPRLWTLALRLPFLSIQAHPVSSSLIDLPSCSFILTHPRSFVNTFPKFFFVNYSTGETYEGIETGPRQTAAPAGSPVCSGFIP